MIKTETLPSPAVRLQRPWVFWLLFFFQYAAIGIYFTYLNIFYRQAGLSGTQIGVMNMIIALVGVSASIGWGYIADRTGANRYLIAGGAFIALIIAQLVPYVHDFWAFLGLGMLAALANSAPGTLVDSTTLVMLGEQRQDYGRYRLGGSVGYVATTLFSGFFYDWVGLKMMFPAYGIIMILFSVIGLFLPTIKPNSRPDQRGKSSILTLIRTPAWILFTLCIFLVWIAAMASITFLAVTLDAMGASQSLIGVSVTIGAIVEIPIMMFSARLLGRFGPVRLLAVAMVVMVFRFILLGLMPAPEWSVAINILNGIAFPFYWNSAVTIANKMAPPGFSGTAQGMLSSTMSLASMVSALLTGWLFDLMGANRLFLVMAGICLLALLIFIIGNLARKTRME